MEELRKFIVEKIEPINKYLFAPEYLAEFTRYKDAVNIYYKQKTKREFDAALQRVLAKLYSEVCSCIDTEYATHDGRLVRHPSQYGQWIDANS